MRLPRFTSLVLTALLAACGSAPTTVGTTTQAASGTPEAVEAYREARDVDCQAAGGTLQRLGRLQREQCVIPYADAGKALAGDAASGTCQRDASQNFGCRQRIDDGKAQGTICVD